MRLINEWYSKENTIKFINTSTPKNNTEFCLYGGKEQYSWVDLYFRYEKTDFRVLLSLAMDDLFNLVSFFESIIDLKEDTAIFLNDEDYSMPLIYISPINEEKIRFFVADGEKTLNSEEEDSDDEDEILFNYEIRCDVIIEKKKILKEFYQAITSIKRDWKKHDYCMDELNYNRWKENFKNIERYVLK